MVYGTHWVVDLSLPSGPKVLQERVCSQLDFLLGEGIAKAVLGNARGMIGLHIVRLSWLSYERIGKMKNLFSLLCQGIVQISMTLKISLAKVACLKRELAQPVQKRK